VVIRDKAYSIEVKPNTDKHWSVILLKGVGPHIHTNHFLNNSRLWVYRDKDESPKRYKYLNKKMMEAKTTELVKIKFLEFLRYRRLINRTSGAFFFTIQKGRPLSCEGELYYNCNPFSISINR
jgi:hypothetical protein